MRPVVLLSVYCFLILVASLLGGWVPLLKRTTHARLHTYLSFSAGVMLGAALCHMLPKAQEQVPEHYSDWVLAGMLGLFLLERS
jgi:zinc and cadmium transporter